MKRHVQLIHKIQAKEESRSYTPRGNANNNSGKLAQVFECEVCQKQFSCASHLRNHEVVHSEERPFKCEFCDKARVLFWFKELSTYRDFDQKNTLEKAFRRKYDKNRHVALVHESESTVQSDDLSNFRATLLQMIQWANATTSSTDNPVKTEPEAPKQVC